MMKKDITVEQVLFALAQGIAMALVEGMKRKRGYETQGNVIYLSNYRNSSQA